ncbi:MAG: right-handed parallel beta-helix repeat-containing protein [Planctomycetes bacterium]|nr:right-handed parallel beta-helix repeat-containing protein [Planctomycetota bacterium]
MSFRTPWGSIRTRRAPTTSSSTAPTNARFASGTQRLINCEFTDNSAEQGGGLHLQLGTALLANCVFHGNTSNFGAGLLIQETESTVIHSTFSMNSAVNRGGGVYLNLESTLTVRNSYREPYGPCTSSVLTSCVP